MLFRTNIDIYVGGYLAAHVLDAHKAAEGEHAAMVWALHWSTLLSNWHLAHFPGATLSFSFSFDSQVTGYQAGGVWRSHVGEIWQSVMRGYVHILNARHGNICTAFHYTPAHSGDYFNELADSLAKFAALHPAQTADCSVWWPLIRDSEFRKAFQHVWMWECMLRGDPGYPSLFGDFLCHIVQAPDPPALPSYLDLPDSGNRVSQPCATAELHVKIATANVLSLSLVPNKKQVGATARQLSLLRQFHENSYHIVAVQESRMKRLLAKHNDYYHVLHHPCTTTGHDGIQLWFSSQLALRPGGRPFCSSDIDIAHVTSSLHSNIVQLLCDHDVQLLLPEEDGAQEVVATHRCPDCQVGFASSKQLANHNWKVHGHRALEAHFVQSTVCGGSLKDHWSTARVIQHLRYRPHGCWDRLYGAKSPDVPADIPVPRHLQGVKRLPATTFHHGPIRPNSNQRLRAGLRDQIRCLRADGEYCLAWWLPTDAGFEWCGPILDALDEGLRLWLRDGPHDVISFHNHFVGLMLDFPCSHFKSGRLFIHWIEHRFYDALTEQCLDPDIIQLADETSYMLLNDLDAWHYRQKMNDLVLRYQQLDDAVTFPRMTALGGVYDAKHLHPIVTRYSQQPAAEAARLKWRFLHRPDVDRKLHGARFIAMHLFSGRRREGDWHYHLQREIAAAPMEGVELIIISLDTAIDESLNVHRAALWDPIIQAALAGRISSLLLGPPCESWSSARHQPLKNYAGETLRGPRPLRSATSPWGLNWLSFFELLQVHTGTQLLLKGLWLAVAIALQGALLIFEHPAMPYDDSFASIWRTGIFRLLTRDSWPIRL
eukprot:Skav220157  [mRNA]  locus=scaffold564:131535:137035:+ [translate_table: standard]